MELLDSIVITGKHSDARLELLYGNLSQIPENHYVDILALSAFPDNYKALPGSLMLALKEKGLSIEELSKHKAADLRNQIGCWISEPIDEALQQQFNFRQILCFEPGAQSANPDQIVGNIFRCLNTFAFDEKNRSIAMPVVATGYQKVPFDTMLPALLDAAIFWLEEGLPLETIKIVIHNPHDLTRGKQIFAERVDPVTRELNKQHNTSSETTRSGNAGHSNSLKDPSVPVNSGSESQAAQVLDYFISYAHVQSTAVEHFVNAMKAANPALKIFFDKSSIPQGGLWIREISNAISKANKVVVFMSPAYSASMICWDEFQCAKLKEYNTKSPIIQTIYLTTDPDLPPIMGIHSYIDCREADIQKLTTACHELLQ